MRKQRLNNEIISFELITVIPFFLMVFIFFLLPGCQRSQPPPVPMTLIEEVNFWDATLNLGELAPYTFPGLPVEYPAKHLTSDERSMVREMFKNNWKCSVNYNGNKAIAVVDLSKSGFVEWLNVNKFKEPPDNNFKRLSVRILAFQYKQGKWWYVASTVPEGWVGFDSERGLAKELLE